MKKFTFLLSLLGLSASSAFAGAFVPSTDGNVHVYAIQNASKTNYYCSVNGNNIWSTSNIGSVAYFKVENGESGQYYLYCLNNNKYVTFSESTNTETKVTTYSNITFVDSKTDAKQWKIKQESGQTERYDIFPNTVTDETSGSSWNWIGGVGNNLGFYGAGDEMSSWTFVEATLGEHTFNYTLGGETRFTKKTIASIVGSDKSAAPASDVRYTSVGSMTPANIAAGTTEYTVNLAEDLPFTTSTDYANAKWFIIDMHNNDSGINGATENYVWTYDAEGEKGHNVILPVTNLKTATYTDNMLWCIIGNVFDGFKIYNKAAGENYTLRKTNTTTNTEDETNGNVACVMSTENTNNLFKLYSPTGSGTSISGKTFCLKLDNDVFYINTQKPSGYTNKVLQGWKEADSGSTCRAFVPNSFIVNATKDYSKFYVKSSELPEGVLGANTYLDEGENLTNFKKHFAAANSDDATLEQINTLVNDWKEISKTSATTIEAGKSYRLYNANTKNWLCIKSNDNTKVNTSTANNTIGSVVTFTSAEPGRFRMMIEGKTLSKFPGMYNPITLENNDSGSKGSYQVNQVGTTFTFQDRANKNQYSYLHDDKNNDRIVGWEVSNDGTMSKTYWHVVPATTAEVDMNLVGSNSYATAYLPFGVSAISGAKAYVGKLNTEKNALDMTEVEGVPAEKGFVLVGTGNKATLTIGTASEVATDLTGTNTAITLTDDNHRANYLVFGKNNADNTKVGFFKTTATTIPANKAFLETSALTQEAIAMNFGGNTTGVNTVVLGENGVNAPVFDLSGRRVVAPVKGGVYIQNGKKFIK